MTISFNDFEVMARTLYGEARGEPWIGKVAVAWIIRNRVEADIAHDNKPDWWGEGYASVCQAPWQFSCWNKNDPMRKKIEAASSYRLTECLRACFAVLTGEEKDPTGGATHYYADYIPEPKWAKGRTPDRIIGRHRFYAI